jgi:hypothetical protein
MTIFTTFNDRMYYATGKSLLSSIKTHLPASGVVIYEELSDGRASEIVDRWNTAITIKTLTSFKEVFEANKDVIPRAFGGEADKVAGDKFWNYRWFGWFRKVVMAHHATCVSDMMEQFGGYFIFIDSDIRFKKGFGDDVLRKLMRGKPIGFFKGDRPEIDSGFIAVDTNSLKPRKFYGYFMDLFLSGRFREYPRWDDIYLMTRLVEQCPQEWFHDFAEGQKMNEYTNSNGHSTVNQIIPFSEMSEYIEHDKGIHIRKNVI